ncbi:MAG: bifunctional glutamate N-acetyltransferase/amino-acid acetyltransferase ArgJ [Verrucomicrobiae bacterium]|nr:bifunctional glutamate N-acetyltransferase/amino-acid acetyltransferase ArgJ [Verrucomicrobiae bacterium]
MRKTVFRVVKGGGVTSPKGFRASGVRCGIKRARRPDFAMIASDTTAVASGVFTTNQIKAAPVRVSMGHIRGQKARAIVANSGNANACTGVEGIADAKETAALTARVLGCSASQLLVCSTGRIGRRLPMEKIRQGILKAFHALSRSGGASAARAIMTSDTARKEIAVSFLIGGRRVTIGACAKGAGMIDPNMATMLCFVTTDAVIDARTLNRCLREAVDESFNRITVDGDMSTNDTVLMLANGASGNPPLRGYHPELPRFQQALNHVLKDLARKIVSDGEGVTRVVEVAVTGAASQLDARRAAVAVAKSTLVKTAWAGGDPNWGRLMAALGYSGARVREELVDICFDGVSAVRGGQLGRCPESRLKASVSKPRFKVMINLHLGEGEHTVYTTDMTVEYVRLNMSE